MSGSVVHPFWRTHTGLMAYVAINVLTVPEGEGATLESRFAGRAGSVDRSPGFERFELLRPVEGTDTYLVYTRWRSQEDYQAWTTSQAFARGHRQSSQTAPQRGAPRDRPAATGSSIWGFEVVQSSEGE